MKFENTHILIGVLALIGLFVMYYIFSGKPIHNEGTVNVSNTLSQDKQSIGSAGTTDINTLIDNLTEAEIKEKPTTADVEDVDQSTLNKLTWKNQASGSKVESSYAGGVRGNSSTDDWDAFYKTNSDLIDKSYIQTNDKFLPSDETGGNFAGYAGKTSASSPFPQKQSTEDLFKVDKLLPQEVNPDWFEVMPEPIKVKNRHLVNVTRPVGVNTIGSSHKNANYDLRPSPSCPSFTIGPWLQSSIQPDLSIKGLN